MPMAFQATKRHVSMNYESNFILFRLLRLLLPIFGQMESREGRVESGAFI